MQGRLKSIGYCFTSPQGRAHNTDDYLRKLSGLVRRAKVAMHNPGLYLQRNLYQDPDAQH